VRLPADTGYGWHHSQDEAAPHQRDDYGEENATEAARVPAGEHQKPKIAEDDTAGSDVHRARGAEQPRHKARSDHSGDGHWDEMPFVAKHYHPAQRQERNGVGDDVTEAAVEKGSEQDSAQADRRAWYHAETEKSAAEERVHDEHRPQHGERAAQNQRLRFEGASYTGSPIGH